MKRTLKIIGVSVLLLVLFRGTIYRLTVRYKEIGKRKEIEVVDKKLIERILRESKNREIDFEEIADIADEITKSELRFSTNRTSTNPNKLIHTKQANCVGYSATFNSIANFLIRKLHLQNEITAEHKIGKLYFLGINVHRFF